jgi:hypothetical protein
LISPAILVPPRNRPADEEDPDIEPQPSTSPERSPPIAHITFSEPVWNPDDYS